MNAFTKKAYRGAGGKTFKGQNQDQSNTRRKLS